jgi:elongation factor P
MLSIAQTKVGMHITFRGEPYRVMYAQHTKIGRGAGILKAKIKNLITGAIIDNTFKDSDRIEEANLTRQPMQFLYRDGDTFNFMDPQNYEQFEIAKDVVGPNADLIKDSTTVDVLSYNEKPIGVILAPKVDLLVTYTESVATGNTVSNVLKDAKVETGATIKVPAFVKNGDMIRINTETGEYVERVR